MNLRRLNVPQRISAVAIVVTALAAFLPWASLFGISKLGIEGDGAITLVIALIGAVLMLATTPVVREGRTPGKAVKITQLVGAILVVLVGIVDMSGVSAIGLYLTFFAGIAWVVGSTWELAAKPEPTTVRDGADEP
jgi:hypothetical protein